MSLENDQKAPGKTWVQCDDTQNWKFKKPKKKKSEVE